MVKLSNRVASLDTKIDRLLAIQSQSPSFVFSQPYHQHAVPVAPMHCQPPLQQYHPQPAPYSSATMTSLPLAAPFVTSQPPIGPGMSAVFPGHTVSGVIELPAGSAPSSPAVRSPMSSPSSPGRFAFQCPICSHPQYTPKSHCGHIRKLIDESGYCRLRNDVTFHVNILRQFGAVSQFVAWYTPHLRSSVGKDFTDADSTAYELLQSKLRAIVSGVNE